MVRTKGAMVQSVTAMVVAVGSLVCLARPAEAFDSGTCNSKFGADNVRFAVAFKIDTGTVGKVDFGDHLHLWGAPQGTAVVCSNRARDVAVVGRLFIDTQNDENIFALAKITYFKGDVVGATSEHNVQGNGTANTLVNTLKSGGGFTKIRLRLYRNSVLVHTKDISL